MLRGKGTLIPIQKDLLYEIGKIPETSFFFLTGGTALAEFYLGHRRSYDLDFFTAEENLLIPFVRRIEEELPKAQYKIQVVRLLGAFAEAEAHREGEAVRLHIACDSPYRFEEPLPSEFGIKINDYRDLIVDKLLTFFGRWKHRDAIDLFFILKSEPIEALMEKAREKDPGFDLYWFCMALREIEAYPDEIAQWPVDMLVEVSVRELKSKFGIPARELMGRIKKDHPG